MYKFGSLIKRLAEKTCIRQTDVTVILSAVVETWRTELLMMGEVDIPAIGKIDLKLIGTRVGRDGATGGPIVTRTKPRWKYTPERTLRWAASMIQDYQVQGKPVGHIMPDGTVDGQKVDLPEGWQFQIRTPAKRFTHMWHRMGLQQYITYGPGFGPNTPEESEQEMAQFLRRRKEWVDRREEQYVSQGMRMARVHKQRLREKAERLVKRQKELEATLAAQKD